MEDTNVHKNSTQPSFDINQKKEQLKKAASGKLDNQVVTLLKDMTEEQVEKLVENGCPISVIQSCVEKDINGNNLTREKGFNLLSKAIEVRKKSHFYKVTKFFLHLIGKQTEVEQAQYLIDCNTDGGLIKLLESDGLPIFKQLSASKINELVEAGCSTDLLAKLAKEEASEGPFGLISAMNRLSEVPTDKRSESFNKFMQEFQDKFTTKNKAFSPTTFDDTAATGIVSTGSRVSDDKTIATVHTQTKDPTYNGDRGVSFQAANGTNVAIVCDATSGSKRHGVHAANKFTMMMANFITHYPDVFEGGENNEEVAKLFTALAKLEPQADGKALFEGRNDTGDATMSVVTFNKTEDGNLKVSGAALGDALAIHVDVDNGKAHQLNQVKRINNNAGDPGGVLIRGRGIDGEVSCFEKKVKDNDLVIVASDGLLDNIDEKEIGNQIPLIIRNSIFDNEIEEDCPWTKKENPHRVTTSELKGLGEKPLEELSSITPEVASKRLENYLMWVTKKQRVEKIGERFKKEEKEALEKIDKERDEKLNEIEEGDDKADKQIAINEEYSEKKVKVKADFKSRWAKFAEASKTDDTLFMVMRPTYGSNKDLIQVVNRSFSNDANKDQVVDLLKNGTSIFEIANAHPEWSLAEKLANHPYATKNLNRAPLAVRAAALKLVSVKKLDLKVAESLIKSLSKEEIVPLMNRGVSLKEIRRAILRTRPGFRANKSDITAAREKLQVALDEDKKRTLSLGEKVLGIDRDMTKRALKGLDKLIELKYSDQIELIKMANDNKLNEEGFGKLFESLGEKEILELLSKKEVTFDQIRSNLMKTKPSINWDKVKLESLKSKLEVLAKAELGENFASIEKTQLTIEQRFLLDALESVKGMIKRK